MKKKEPKPKNHLEHNLNRRIMTLPTETRTQGQDPWSKEIQSSTEHPAPFHISPSPLKSITEKEKKP